MKITTWNVNGIRAALRKGVWDWVVQESPDVLCLQEVKAREDQLSQKQISDLGNYKIYWNAAERPGYSGVVSLLRNGSEDVMSGMDSHEFDIEGRLIRSRHDGFLLFNVYIPNGQRGQERIEYKLRFYERLLEICDSLHEFGENIIICGDFNTAHQEMDLRNPKENQNTSGFLPEEREWIDKYLEHGFVDAYRMLYPEKVQYTWWTYRYNARKRNIGWRLDYFLISEGLSINVRDVIVHEDILGSDHCPVSLIIN
jgi:exodeoxyribonuclease-3